jgi:hypothetical protein
MGYTSDYLQRWIVLRLEDFKLVNQISLSTPQLSEHETPHMYW